MSGMAVYDDFFHYQKGIYKAAYGGYVGDHAICIVGYDDAGGYWICKKTSWGFTRYRWVIAKWIGTLLGILSGTGLLGPWQMQMVKLSNQLESALVFASKFYERFSTR